MAVSIFITFRRGPLIITDSCQVLVKGPPCYEQAFLSNADSEIAIDDVSNPLLLGFGAPFTKEVEWGATEASSLSFFFGGWMRQACGCLCQVCCAPKMNLRISSINLLNCILAVES